MAETSPVLTLSMVPDFYLLISSVATPQAAPNRSAWRRASCGSSADIYSAHITDHGECRLINSKLVKRAPPRPTGDFAPAPNYLIKKYSIGAVKPACSLTVIIGASSGNLAWQAYRCLLSFALHRGVAWREGGNAFGRNEQME